MSSKCILFFLNLTINFNCFAGPGYTGPASGGPKGGSGGYGGGKGKGGGGKGKGGPAIPGHGPVVFLLHLVCWWIVPTSIETPFYWTKKVLHKVSSSDLPLFALEEFFKPSGIFMVDSESTSIFVQQRQKKQQPIQVIWYYPESHESWFSTQIFTITANCIKDEYTFEILV